MTQKQNYLSRLMRISWQIQRNRNSTRSKALQSAWAIYNNEDITVHYLTRKLNHHKPITGKMNDQFSLFNK
jgi:hypothetical protein